MILSYKYNYKHNTVQPQIQHNFIPWKSKEFSNFKQSHNSRITQSIQNITGIFHPTGCNSNNYFYRIMNGDLYAIETIISISSKSPANWTELTKRLAGYGIKCMYIQERPMFNSQKQNWFSVQENNNNNFGSFLASLPTPPHPPLLPNILHFCLFTCFGRLCSWMNVMLCIVTIPMASTAADVFP